MEENARKGVGEGEKLGRREGDREVERKEKVDILQYRASRNFLYYRIVLGKHSWAVAAQAPKIEGARLHGK